MKIPWYLMAKGKGGGGYKTASGPIVSINDALAAPLRSLRIAIDPVQDLHGYDSPWPAGGGKNLFAPYTERSSNAGIDYTVNQDGSINCKGTATSASYSGTNPHYDNAPLVIKAGTYTVSANGFSATGGAQGYLSFGARYSDDTLIQFTAIRNSSYTITLEQDAHCFYWIYVQNGRTIDENIYIQIETGTTQTSWTPYSNLCPISGHTGGNVWRTGRNLLDVADSQIETTSAYNKSAGTTLTFGGTGASVSGTNPIEIAVTTGWRGATFFSKPLKVGATYYLRYRITAPSPGYIKRTIYWVDDDNKIVVNVGYSSSVDQSAEYVYHNTLTPPQDGLRLAFVVESQTSQTVTIYDMGVMVGDWETYTPYTGTTIPVTFTEAGTVYGGVWDVLAGVLKKTWGKAILANRTWTMETTENGNVFSCNLLPDKAKSYNQMCSKYKTVETYRSYLKNGEMGTYNATNGRNRVSICDNTYSTVDDFVDGLAGVDYIYELATPITYTLTPQQLDTLAGQNVVWADAGDVTVEYLASGGANADLMKLAVAFMGRK